MLYFRGFAFTFVGKCDLKGKNYNLVVKDFPCVINQCGSSWKPRENAVDVKLNVLVRLHFQNNHLENQPANPKEVEAMLRDERYVEEDE